MRRKVLVEFWSQKFEVLKKFKNSNLGLIQFFFPDDKFLLLRLISNFDDKFKTLKRQNFNLR